MFYVEYMYSFSGISFKKTLIPYFPKERKPESLLSNVSVGQWLYQSRAVWKIALSAGRAV